MQPSPDRPPLSGGSAADSELARYQQRFAAYVRSPSSARMPAGLEPERMRIYRELMLGNVSGFLHSCFPVLRQSLGARRWGTLVHRFFAQHRSTTPYFREIPAEFVAWLFDDARQRLSNEPAHLPYLAHYEWLELAVDTHPDEPAAPLVRPWTGEPCATPVLNPTLRLACYPYPVHRIGPAEADGPPPMQTTWLMVWRNAQDRVRFGELSAASFELLRTLQALQQSVTQLAKSMNSASPQAGRTVSAEQVLPLLSDLVEMGVVLGARADQR